MLGDTDQSICCAQPRYECGFQSFNKTLSSRTVGTWRGQNGAQIGENLGAGKIQEALTEDVC